MRRPAYGAGMVEEPPWGWRIGWPIGWLAGCLGLAAALAGLPWTFAGGPFRVMALSAVVATVLLGLAAERVLARAPVTDGVGALAGIAVALLAHPGMALVFAAVLAPGGEFDSAGDLAAGVFGVTVLSLLYWGWVTVPLGGLAGWAAGALVLRHQARRGAGDRARGRRACGLTPPLDRVAAAASSSLDCDPVPELQPWTRPQSDRSLWRHPAGRAGRRWGGGSGIRTRDGVEAPNRISSAAP